MEHSPKIHVVSATEAKNRFGDILKGAYQRSEHTVIERDGIPVAVIVPVQDYSTLKGINGKGPTAPYLGENESDEARARYRLKKFLDERAKIAPDYPEEEVERDIEAAIRAVRGK